MIPSRQAIPRRPGPVAAPYVPHITLLQITILVSFALAAVGWGIAVSRGGGGLVLERYLLLLGFYGAASAAFVISRITKSYAEIFDLPVFLTAYCFLGFGLSPLLTFFDPDLLNPWFHRDFEPLIKALFYVILGMIGFWLGSQFIHRRTLRTADATPESKGIPRLPLYGSYLGWAMLIYAVAFGTKVYLLEINLWGWTGSLDPYFARLGEMQILNFMATLGSVALTILAIEKYFHPTDKLRKFLFWVVLGSESVWGLISGVRGTLFQNFLLVALVASLIKRRFQKEWVFIPLAGLFLLFPVVTRYRSLMVTSRGTQIAPTAKIRSVGGQALTEIRQSTEGVGNWFEQGARQTIDRVNMLESVAALLMLRSHADLLQGDERLWMLPIYPFVPRIIWPSKPILDKPGRFTRALGGRESATALTYPGDLLLDYGVPGLLIGMFILGAFCERVTKLVKGRLGKDNVFLYAGLFSVTFGPETPVFDYWASVIKVAAIMSLLRWLIYGPRRAEPRLPHAAGARVRAS
jgi:hypothetical protein